jgi:hypothetical protein
MGLLIVTFDARTGNYRTHAMGCNAIGNLVILGTYGNLEDCEQAFCDDAAEKSQAGQYAVCKCCRGAERVAPLVIRKSKPM